MNNIKFLFFFFILLIWISFESQSQNNHELWISTNNDEYPGKSINYAPDRILLITYEELETKSAFNEFSFLNKVYKFNFELETLATLTIKNLDEYSIRIMDLISSEPGEIILFAQAKHLSTEDYQLCFIYLDHDLNYISASFFGDINNQEVIENYTINQSGNFVFVGSGSPEINEGGYILWEFSPEGNEIGFHTFMESQAINPSIIELPGALAYHICDSYGTLKFNQDFELIDIYNWNETINISPDNPVKAVDNQTYIRQGTYLLPPIPGEPWEIDYAFLHIDANGEILTIQTFGNEGEVDLPADLDFLTSDTIYFAGTRNVESNPPENSWISIYKTNLTGDIFNIIEIGGDGFYVTQDIVALSTNGFLVSATFWDFENYPSPDDQRDIYLYTINYGDTAIFINDPTQPIADFPKVFPNPANNVLNILTENITNELRIFDILGNLVLTHHFQKITNINIEHLSAGIYCYYLQTDNNIINQGKFVKN